MKIQCLIAAVFVLLFVAQWTSAASTDSTACPGGFQFDGKISRQALENFPSRSICIEGILNGRGPVTDDIRMITNCGVKYIARALCLWGGENNFLDNLKPAKETARQILAADPEIVLKSCVFEAVGPKISQRPKEYLLKEGGSHDAWCQPVEYPFPCLKPVGQITIGMDAFHGTQPPILLVDPVAMVF
jgi:hypothetical protein